MYFFFIVTCLLFLTYLALIAVSAGRRKFRTFILVLSCVISFILSDYLHVHYIGGPTLEAAINLVGGFCLLLIANVIFVDAIIIRLIQRFSSDENKDARVIDFLFWFVGGALFPLSVIGTPIFSRLPGIAVLLGLYGSAILAFVCYHLLHRRRLHIKYPYLAILPGYALTMTACVIASLGLGYYVAWSAERMAGKSPHCLVDGSEPVTSTFDMSPFTLISSDGADYHVVLAVDQKQFYNWSWHSLSFTPANMDYVYFVACSKN
jgi:hypothetical protein